MRVISFQIKVFGGESLNGLHLFENLQSGERPRFAFQLLFQGCNVVVVDVGVAQDVDEFARLMIQDRYKIVISISISIN